MKKLVVKAGLDLGMERVLKVGEIVESLRVEGGKYQILVQGVGCGVFNTEEFNTYFEEYKEKQINEIKNIHINGLSQKVKVIRNEKVTVVVLDGGIKGVSKCLEEDTYDKAKGFEIAYTKACIKRLNKNLKELVK